MGVKQDHPADGGKWGAYRSGGEECIGKYSTRGEAITAYEAAIAPPPPKPAKKAAKKKG